MLAGKYRLHGSYYIKRAKERGKLYQFKTFGLSIFKRVVVRKDANRVDRPTQFVFVVSTKVAKHAVDRNRIKRVISETVRYESNRLVNGYDVAFLTKPIIARTPTDEIMNEVRIALKKTGLISS